jgi:glycosyltransferase involved in cell wall biosynthesis
MRILTLPDMATFLALGAKGESLPNGDMLLSFEGTSVRMHADDYSLAKRVAAKIRAALPKGALSFGSVVAARNDAHRMIVDEVLKPGAKRLLFYPALNEGSSFWRCVMPTVALNQGKRISAMMTRQRFGREALDADVVVIQIDHTPAAQTFAERLQALGKKVVYDLDDAFDALEPWHPQYAYYSQPRTQDAVKAMMKLADAVSVSTQVLAARYADVGAKRIEVMPNLIDVGRWPRSIPRNDRKGFRILWAASASHAGDMDIAAPAVVEFLKAHSDAGIVFFGPAPMIPGLPATQVEYVPYVDFSEYPATLAAIDADVAIAPLANCEFNRAKSPIRVLEYWATGYPVVAADLAPYRILRHGEEGLLCADGDDWRNALEALYRDETKRQLLREAGFNAVRFYDSHDPENYGKFEDFYHSL